MVLAYHAANNSARDLLRLQSEGGVEFVNGRVMEKPASIESSEVEATIMYLLANDAARTKAARVFPPSMGYRCFGADPTGYRKPDVSVVRSERLERLEPRTELIPFPADLAVEVISANDLACDISERIEEYLGNRFPLIWVVYPNTHSVNTYHGDGSVSRLREQDEITGKAALPNFRCKVAEFFVK